MWSFYGIFPYRRNAWKYLFAFYKSVFFLSLPLLHEILFPARIWQVVVNLCYATFLDSLLGKQEYCQQFRSVLRNIRTCWIRQSTLFYITKLDGVSTIPSCLLIKLLHHGSTLCMEWRIQVGALRMRTPPAQFLSFPCSFWQTICKIIGWNTPLGVGFPLPLENPGSATGMTKNCAHIL